MTAIMWCSQHHDVVDLGRTACRSVYRRQAAGDAEISACRITHRVELVPVENGSDRA